MLTCLDSSTTPTGARRKETKSLGVTKVLTAVPLVLLLKSLPSKRQGSRDPVPMWGDHSPTSEFERLPLESRTQLTDSISRDSRSAPCDPSHLTEGRVIEIRIRRAEIMAIEDVEELGRNRCSQAILRGVYVRDGTSTWKTRRVVFGVYPPGCNSGIRRITSTPIPIVARHGLAIP